MTLTLAQAASEDQLVTLDWIILGAYFAVIIATGIWFSRRKQESTDDYFKGSSRLPAWAVAVSIVATSLSAASFLGVPESSFTGDMTYLSTNIGMILASLVVAFVFLPAFYRLSVASIYEYLEHRYGRSASMAASAAFLLGRLLASGARLFLVAIPLTMIIFGVEAELKVSYVSIAVVIITLVGIFYTLIGGISSVIWTDVVQYAVLMSAGIVAIILIALHIDAPFAEVINALSTGNAGESKFTLIDPDPDPRLPFTLLTATIGFTVLGIGSYGTDQDLAQRMLTCKNAKEGARSVIGGILLGIPTVAVFLLVGLALWIYYSRPDLIAGGQASRADDDSRKVFLAFIMTEMPAGLAGLMIAGLFAAGLSSVNSAMNAMSAAFVTDFYQILRPGMPPKHYVSVGRLGVIVFGVLLGLFACLCVIWQQHDREHQKSSELLNFALGVMAFAYAGLVPVFLTAIVTKRGNAVSIILTLIIGFVLTLLLQPAIWHEEVLIDQSGELNLWGHVLSLHFSWRLCIAAGVGMIVANIPRGTHP